MQRLLPDIVLETLAADLACAVEDLLQRRTTVNVFKAMAGRRRFPFRDVMLQAVTVGEGAVICVDAGREAWARDVLAPLAPEAVFAHHGLSAIYQRLAADGVEAIGPSPSYLCHKATLRAVPRPAGFRIELLTGKAIEPLYRHEGLQMALSYYTEGDRPDTMASVAWQGEELVGVAACSADNEQMWQVGIDVRPEWRGRGVAKWLVHQVTSAILDSGRIPYYATGLHNLASQRIAAAVGYYPAWTSLWSR